MKNKKVLFPRRLISCVLTVLTLAVSFTAVSAEQPESPYIIERVRYLVATDTNTLLQALNEPFRQDGDRSRMLIDPSGEGYIDQIKSVTYYSDGSQTIERVRNAIGIYRSDPPEIIIPDDLIGPYNGTNYKNLSWKNIFVNIQTDYQTWTENPPQIVGGALYGRIVSCTVTLLGDQYPGHMATKLEMGIWSRQYIWEPTKGCSAAYSYPSSQQPYTLYNSDQTIYKEIGEYNFDIYSKVAVTFDDGKVLQLEIPYPWRT